MKKIEISLCGNPTILADDEKVNFPYKKVEGLLYYLCVKKSVTREEIICLLWGDEDETTGKKKLRDAVYQVRRFLDKDVLITTGHTGISLNPDYPITVDFDLVKRGEYEPAGLFLDHFFIKNCYEFEQWVEGIREEQRISVTASVREKLEEAKAAQDTVRLQKYSNILIKNDPYNEEIYYEIMNLYAENGSYTMAIRLYYDLVKLFQEELGVEPSQKTKDLFHRVFNVKEHMQTEGGPVELPFIGRKKELYELSGFLEGAAGERVNCIAVEGEEGVGKSSFIECGLKLAAGKQMICLYSVCYRQGVDFFLSPWIDIFQEMKQHVENGTLANVFSEEEKEKLGQLLSRGMGEEKESGRLTYQSIEKTVWQLFQVLTEKYRVVLAFDDIQWMDQMSFQLLNRLLFTSDPNRLLLICSYNRSNEPEVMEALEPMIRRDNLKLLDLQPFTAEETAELLHKTLPELDGESEKRDKIYEMTDGNAFFLKEMINIIREKGYTLEKSPKTNFVIKARLSGISQDEKEVLDCMSVFPEKISIEEIEFLTKNLDRLTLLRILDRLQDGFLIREVLVGWNVYYKFVHRIFQEYIYERQSNGKKQLYHRMLAEYYEAQSEQSFAMFPRVVYHYEKCHDQVKAYHYQIRYLKEFYTILNENFPVLHAEASDLGDDYGVLAEAEKMLKLAENVIRLVSDSQEIRQMKMEMYYIKGRYDIAMGDYETGVACIEQSISLSQRLNAHRNLLACYKQQIFYGIQKEDLDRVDQYVTLGLECIGKDEEDEYATFLRLKGWYHLQKQEFTMAEESLQRSLSVFQDLEQGTGKYGASIAASYNYIGDIYRMQKRYQEALGYYEKAMKVGQGPVETNGIGQIYSGIGQVMYYEARYEDAKHNLERAKECLEKNGYRWGLERAETYLAMTCLKMGQQEEAKEHYLRGRELSDKIGNPTTEELLLELEKEFSE